MPESGLTLELPDAAATEALGAALAAALPAGSVLLTLAGDLGAGKTTLSRGLLRALGVTGPIRSPTYTLVEPYATRAGEVLHLDLYRLAGPDELGELGYRDLAASAALVVVEWPERAAAALGAADLELRLDLAGDGRRVVLAAGSPRGEQWLGDLAGRMAAAGGQMKDRPEI